MDIRFGALLLKEIQERNSIFPAEHSKDKKEWLSAKFPKKFKQLQ